MNAPRHAIPIQRSVAACCTTLLLIAVSLLASGCDSEGGGDVTVTAEMRIVSLAPAITQMVIDLGLEDKLVGVAENDNAAPKGLPVVGNYLQPNIEAIINLRPTQVLTMKGKEGVPPTLQDASKIYGFWLAAYEVPKTVREVTDILLLDTEFLPPDMMTAQGIASESDKKTISLGYMLDSQVEAGTLKLAMRIQLGALSRVTSQYVLDRERAQIREYRAMLEKLPPKAPTPPPPTPAKPKVMMVIGSNPLTAVGPGTVLDDLLNYIGAENAFAQATVSAPVASQEDIVYFKPSVVLIIEPNGKPLGKLEEDARLSALKGLDIPAVRNQRIYLIDHPLAKLPSSSLVEVATVMAKKLFPNLAETIDKTLEAAKAEAEPGKAIDTTDPVLTPGIGTPIDGDKPTTSPAGRPLVPQDDQPDETAK